ncbi:KN motif and ankyrin repeat domain-containing protein 1-like isoform X2 [Melanotaenia boesemani]|uniref:KN motif and ankyrin repeat domain-containing protein 1-like isoform X2 n=1 Tax=Melanotaenia boesemani TaxID=1250792 RepID=UPI001C058366|nr:KN motif and ankyrin repeat domain-containing protein 1-like isoform X2 [Melanotaenia boesemani]
MAQDSYILRDVSGQSTEECSPNYLGVDCSYQLDVDSFQNGTTIKRLSLKRRPRVALNNVEKTQGGISSGQWNSAESLSSSGSGDTRLLGISSAAKGRPPLPPPHGSSMDSKPSKSEGPNTSAIFTQSKPQPAVRCLASQRQNPVIEQTTGETHKHINQDVVGQSPPQPFPRRRLASFGGVSSPGSLSPFTGLGAYNQNNNGNKPTSDINIHLSSSQGSRGSTGSLRLSPQSSGRSTPVTSLGAMHLQHIRDQMVVALQKLKELEEQVKIIPILQVKISVLQEEKRQLVSQLKNQSESEDLKDVIWKQSSGTESSGIRNEVNTEAELEGIEKSDYTDFREFRQLTEEMQALERAIKGGHFQSQRGKDHISLQVKTVKSVAVGTDINMETAFSKPSKENKYVYTDQVETRSIATGVSEINLGIYAEQEEELVAQQLLNEALKERICQLEAELKESALQTELTRLKLELQAAGVRNRVDKACLARPSTVSIGTEMKLLTKSQGVGDHTEFRDASTGEVITVKTVGVSCEPKMKNICTGPDVPMNQWEVRERVETREKAVGIRVFTSTQGVGTEIKLCNAEMNTEVPVDNLRLKKEQIKCHSVACGDFVVDLTACEEKETVSQGMTTDPVRGVDLGIMASPQMASQRTNTVSSLVSRFTNTRQAFSSDSSTNTLVSTQDKHTNTTHTFTRTVSVGSRVRDLTCTTETRTIGVDTANLPESISKQTPEMTIKVTRDSGVGYTNIYDNFLVGLTTRNMASGPSHLPDPIKTKSIGVGEGRIQDFSVSSGTHRQKPQQSTQFQWDQELNHYIEKMHMLLREHGDLLTGDTTDRCSSSKPLCNNKAVAEGGTDKHQFTTYPTANTELQFPSQPSADFCRSGRANAEICQSGGNNSEVKRMIKMLEQQASSAMQDGSTNASKPKSVIKKQSGDQCCGSNRKSMKFMRVTTGLDPMSVYEQDEVERRGNEAFKDSSQDGIQGKTGNDGSNKGSKGTARSYWQSRCRLNERMLSACQALKMHLSDDTPLSSRELDCLHTLQREWFSVSSHKSAAPDIVEDYLSTFRIISPSVLQHIANIADGNGNTALHYSVSHSNFGIVKKLLEAEVCSVNQQNTAGYTPIMLAALAAVEHPEDMKVVEQLFAKGDVNAKATQAGQTALMLAVSHGRLDMVQALLAQGAEVNIQDDEGSTALMCASEHGHADIVKLLLAQPECDATLTDSDDSTALSIALEAGHNDIAVLLYAHANFFRQTGAAARHSGRFLSSSGGRNVFE